MTRLVSYVGFIFSRSDMGDDGTLKEQLTKIVLLAPYYCSLMGERVKTYVYYLCHDFSLARRLLSILANCLV